MLFRLKLLVVIGGCVLSWFGLQEFRVSLGTSSEPTAVELSALEAGDALPNNHIVLGPHIAVYDASFYEYKQSKYSSASPSNSTKVNHVYYPVLSHEHPFIQKLAELSQQHENLSEVADHEFPTLENFRVVVKSKQFKTVGAIPNGMPLKDKLQGLVINDIDGLDSEEKQLIRSSFPGENFDELLILDAGRKPASFAKSLGMLFGGAVLAIAGVGSFFLLQ